MPFFPTAHITSVARAEGGLQVEFSANLRTRRKRAEGWQNGLH